MQPRDYPPGDDEELDQEDDPNDPRHPDHDLSDRAPYEPFRDDEDPARPWFTRRWVLLIVAAVVITSLMLPFVRIVQ